MADLEPASNNYIQIDLSVLSSLVIKGQSRELSRDNFDKFNIIAWLALKIDPSSFGVPLL